MGLFGISLKPFQRAVGLRKDDEYEYDAAFTSEYDYEEGQLPDSPTKRLSGSTCYTFMVTYPNFFEKYRDVLIYSPRTRPMADDGGSSR